MYVYVCACTNLFHHEVRFHFLHIILHLLPELALTGAEIISDELAFNMSDERSVRVYVNLSFQMQRTLEHGELR